MPSYYLDERAFTMIKKSLFYSIILLACFTAHDTLSVGLTIPDLSIFLPITGVATIGACITTLKIGNFLQPIGANLGTKAWESLGTLIVKSGNALIDNSSTIGNATGTIGSYAIGGAIGFTVCLFAGIKLAMLCEKKRNQKHWKLYEKIREQEYRKIIKEEEEKDLDDSPKNHSVD